jgi:hypothetical protein
MRRWRVFALMLALLTPLRADAQQQPQHPAMLSRRDANYAWDKDLLLASFSYRDVLSDPLLMSKLSSGLPMEIVMRAYVFREGQDAPIALALKRCRVVYDLWDEIYRVHLEPSADKGDKTLLFNGVLRLCTEAQDLPVAQRALLTAGQQYFLGVVVDVNPVSPELVEQMRRWMARPTGSTGIAPSDALFGSFVQLFVRQIATSDKTLTFRTGTVVP